MTRRPPSPPSLYAAVRGLPGPVYWLFAGSFVNRFGSFVVVFVVLYLTDLGFSPAQAGLVVAAYGAGGFAAAIAGGYLADRVGRRETIVASMLGSAVAMLALSQLRSLPAIVAVTALAGLAAELYRPASSALLADLVPAGERVPAFAAYRLAINAGFAVGPAVAGLMAERSFLLLFVGDALTSVVYAIVAWVKLPRGARSTARAERRGEALRVVAGDRRFVRFLVSVLLGAFVFLQAQTTVALHVLDVGLSEATYGLLASINGALIVAIELPVVSVTRRLPATRVIAVGMLVTGVGFALTGVATTVLALAGTVVIWTVGEMINAPVASAYVADVSPVHLRGRYAGAYSVTFSVAAVAAPLVGTAVYELSPAALWLGCLGAGTLSALLALTCERTRVRPDVASMPPGVEIPTADG